METRLRGVLLVSWLVLALGNARLGSCIGVHGPRGLYDQRPAAVTAPARQPRNATWIERRAIIMTELSTCGYLNGDPKKIRTANDGFDCRVDTSNGLWGFCPTTVIAATDCGLAGSCFDSHSCSTGCGLTDKTQLTTFTCEKKDYCSLALLTFGVDQTYSYVACGGAPVTDHFLISPTTPPPTTTTTTTSSSSTSTTTTSSTSASTSPPTTGPTASSPRVTEPPSQTSAASHTTGSNSDNNKGRDNNIGPIIGGVIGGIALLCGSVIAVVYILRKKRTSAGTGTTSSSEANGEPPFKQSLYVSGGGGGGGGMHELGGGTDLPTVYELSSLHTHQHGRYAELPT